VARRRQLIAMLAFLALAVAAWSACASSTRERWLEALFDDPPGPKGEEDAAVEAVALVSEPETPTPRPGREITWEGSWHGPHAAGLCQSCHTGSGENPVADGRSARLRRPPEQLCVGCHSRDSLLDLLDAEGPSSLHGPVASGHCMACHLPHRSRQPALLRVAQEDLCLGCHRPDDVGPDHPEVDGIDCTLCHDPHAPGDFSGASP